MARLTYNNQGGILGGPLTNVATTINFAVAPNFATITGSDYIPLALDPGTATFEIVYLTAYTAGATTGTIARAQEDSTHWPAVSHLSTGTWVAAPTILDGKYPYNTPAGFIYNNAGGTIAYNTNAQITGNLTGYLRGGMTVASDNLVVPVAGIYLITAAINWPAWATPAASLAATYVYQNGSAIRITSQGIAVSNYTVIQCTTRALCVAGDTLAYFGYHNSTTTQSYAGGGQGTFMAVDLVSTP